MSETVFKMAVCSQMFLFLFKSKYRRKYEFYSILSVIVIFQFLVVSIKCLSNKCDDVHCVNGECINGTCVCLDGWQGSACHSCAGKIRVSGPSGTIYDGPGNYSVDVKCSWLIDAGGMANSTIRLHIEEFATECGWDHLYIFDGDSVHSPLLAVYSGLMYQGDYSIRRIPEVVTHSGYALIHFYSDVAYNMTGFNITYSLNSCPSRISHVNCSGNGVCIDGTCTCDAMFTGEACDVPICPNNCSYSNGECRREQHQCVCNPKYKGDDCSQVADAGYWEVISPKDFMPEGTASHGAVVWRDSLYIIGGESYHRAHMIYVYDFNGNVWETPQMDSRTSPTPRYGHSVALFGDKIYMYGGVKQGGEVCNELWAFDVSAKTWENITVRIDSCHNNVTSSFSQSYLCGPLKSAGHTATLVTNKANKSERMIIIFGHSPTYGFLNTVQDYHFGTRNWTIVKTKGFIVKGGYGHSAAWDPISQKIYVYGGFVSESSSSSYLSKMIYSYEPNTRTWTMLMSAPSARFLHSATFMGSLMLVYGGNTHNDTASSHGAKCYSQDFLAYDRVCDTWSSIQVPNNLRAHLARFGHSASIFENSIYIYGGFDGQMVNDILKFTPGVCNSSMSQSACLSSKLGVKCVWHRKWNRCLSYEQSLLLPNEEGLINQCQEESRSHVANAIGLCSSLKDCNSCVQTSLKCGWCPSGSCIYDEQCKEPNEQSDGFSYVRPYESEPSCNKTDDAIICAQYHSCQACSLLPQCHWHENGPCKPIANLTLDDQREVGVSCVSSCAQFTSCFNCTQEECIWCQNEERCVDKNAYTASFPYGQCREWTTVQQRCKISSSGESACGSYHSCTECRNDPECGWCDDGSNTGLGHCLPGGSNGPHSPMTCAPHLWAFTYCPTCQCNGHSTCPNNTSVCGPCANLTQGRNCHQCQPGYYGNPLNGGKCEPCECNGQGTQCHGDTGKCYCTTKGIVGDRCDKCDSQNHYHGDPTNGGSCFYELAIDYQFTFNLSKKEDKHYQQINFRNSPTKPDIDAEFSITCSVMAKMNITIKTANSAEKPFLTAHNCTQSYKTKFLKTDYIFGTENNISMTTFLVYVYDFHPPLWIQISFSQYPKLNLQQFFVTFTSCFLLLLLVAAILWKIKQKYDMYRRRQRLFVEMEQMASRPFSQVAVEIERKDQNTIYDDVTTLTVSSSLKRRKKDSPSPIALEPCAGNRAAVLSLLVRQPMGCESFTPSGQSAGLVIASALVTLGNPRKVSIDPSAKIDTTKTKIRKSSQHPDSCI
ncbi:unnamed protein product [Bemisia tabaci]|uniref:Attractin n=1 Tax=Bemisia tabaci TaxID=7038 RepID=A0A9P0F9J1_BEMTA|nr:unnamed protein product [Bemisia tabaci]